MDYSKITLGELLSSQDDIIRRNAVSILKRYQNKDYDDDIRELKRLEKILSKETEWRNQ